MSEPNKTKPKVTIKRKKPAASPSPPAAEQARDAAMPTLTRQDVDAITRLADYAQRLNLAEYIKLTQKPKRLIGLNFLVGISRGFGMAVGFTLLGALGIYIIQQLDVLNLPLIGDFIAQLLEYVEVARGMRV